MHIFGHEVLDARVVCANIFECDVGRVGVLGVVVRPHKAMYGIGACADLPLLGVDAPSGEGGSGLGDKVACGGVVGEDGTNEVGVDRGGFWHEKSLSCR